MKKVLTLLLAAVLSLALVACSSPVAAQEAKSDKARETAPQTTAAELEELIAGNSEFAFNLYQSLKDEDGNLFFSPYSLTLALAMAYAGARGETAAQMADTLGFTLSDETLHEAFNYLALELAKRSKIPNKTLSGKDDEGFRFNVVNDAWGQRDYHFESAFLDTLAVNYGAGIRLVDFIKDAEGARQIINDYIEEKTEGRIEDLIPEGAVDAMTRLVLTNAIYFNAAWAAPFDEEATVDATFSLLDGTTITVPMMNQTEMYRYAKGDGYQAVELPYDGDQLSMVILLPEADNFTAFEEAMSADKVAAIIASLKMSNVKLSMPKFEFDSTFTSLARQLADMGMSIAFSTAADFSGITGGPDLFISDVVHKAFVSVDEAGTEAAAASAVIFKVTGIDAPLNFFTADHPFIFLIRDIPTGAVLFVGRVMDPGA